MIVTYDCQNILTVQATEYHNTAMPYSFQKDDPIWYEDFSMTGEKLKLTPK
jgi:hypothetical protein